MFFYSTMLTNFLLLLCLSGPVFPREPPDVDCILLHLETVHCTWHTTINYTFKSRFYGEHFSECERYLTQGSINNGCIQPYSDRSNRFRTFYTQLAHSNSTFLKEHNLEKKVKLNPPTNVTVQNGSDLNLWFYWNQTTPNCVENEVRYRTNFKKWDTHRVTPRKQNYCINLPSSRSRYELQVRSKMEKTCGESPIWSEWSEPVVWGSNNGTETDRPEAGYSMLVRILVYVLPPAILALMVILLLQYERFRIRFIPVVPKPTPIPQDIVGWLQISKSLKEGFKTSYYEHGCPVREYQGSDSDSQCSDDSISFLNTEPTDALSIDTAHSCSSATVPPTSTKVLSD
nr:cytokine receptor common subunit gamma-like [Nerophis lumbriciformis]